MCRALYLAIFCLFLVVATAARDEPRFAGANLGPRRLKSSGGIGAFSPPAPGFTRDGIGSAAAAAGVLPGLLVGIFVLLLL
jgi:hypothetical protein